MKKILITGANSYVGTNFEKWIKHYPDKYVVDTLDMRGESWKSYNFMGYDVVFHVAGIAHTKTTKANKELYYKVNTMLANETAKTAKKQKVKQFIFMSSMYVMYDMQKCAVDNERIEMKYSQPIVKKTIYGESKLLAEQGIESLCDDSFKVAILRPPMIYGKNCTGNYPRLAKVAMKTPIFPKYNNKRSMLYIDNLCEFVRLIIDNEDRGVFFPQNIEYVNTYELVELISQVHGKKVWFIKSFNPIIWLLKDKISVLNKVFGDCIYDRDLSEYKQSYCTANFKESVIASEL